MKTNHTFTPLLVSNGDYIQYVHDGRCYEPTAKRTTSEGYPTEDDAMKEGENIFADRDELDHIVVIERDKDSNFVGGSY